MDGHHPLAKLKSHFKGARFFANRVEKRLSGGAIAFENRPPRVPGEQQDRNA